VREAAARRWRPAPSSSPSPLWASENEGEEREERFFFIFFTDGSAGAKKYLDIGREGKLSIYSCAQILTRSKSRLILAEERAGRSCTVKSRS